MIFLVYYINMETYLHQNRLVYSSIEAAFDDLICWWTSLTGLYQMLDHAGTWLLPLCFRTHLSRQSSELKRWSIFDAKTTTKKNTLKIWCAMRVLDEEFNLWSHSGNRSVQIISKCRANEIHARHFSGRPTQRIKNRIVSWNVNGETFGVRWGNIDASLFGRTAQKCGSITLLHQKSQNNMPYNNNTVAISLSI
jgi:hypothetical protein